MKQIIYISIKHYRNARWTSSSKSVIKKQITNLTYSELPPRASSHLAVLQRYLDRQVRRFLGWRTSLTSNVRSSTSLEKNLKKERSTTSSHQKRSIFMLQPRTSKHPVTVLAFGRDYFRSTKFTSSSILLLFRGRKHLRGVSTIHLGRTKHVASKSNL